MSEAFDILIIGGGINGAGIARDAAGRGHRVLLLEQGDLAGATSSASTKLIHGGLRYLEHFEFALVREALAERERLMAAAPHLIRPLTFVLPHEPHLRPKLLIRAGLFLYDHLANRRVLPAARRVDLARSPLGAGLKPEFETGFSYADCFGDDARLVIANALDARAHGAQIRTHARLTLARRRESHWQAEIETHGKTESVEARILINAAGPWVDRAAKLAGFAGGEPLALVKGSHIVTRRLSAGQHAYILQHPDGRIVFVIPYEEDFTLIGTTDVPFAGPPGPVSISPEETDYLCRSVNRYLRAQIGPADVVWSYAGLRALQPGEAGNPAALSRDYSLDLDDAGAPMLSVRGGKITTFRRLAEHAMEKLRPFLKAGGSPWTARAKLPGGDIPDGDVAGLVSEIVATAPFLPSAVAQRWARSYGTRYRHILGSAKSWPALGRDFGAGLSEAEVDYLVQEEWAVSAEDMLWRRSKLGLHMDVARAAGLARHLEDKG